MELTLTTLDWIVGGGALVVNILPTIVVPAAITAILKIPRYEENT